MVGSLEKNGLAVEIQSEDFDPMAVIPEPVPSVVLSNGDLGHEEGDDNKIHEKKREIVLGRNVHTTCLAVTEPEANDEFTGDTDAYMAGVLARYRKNLLERTKYHLGIAFFPHQISKS